ncbi:MAG: Vi polysaccharide biosynthesis UDP-N-acetylglucosamine C-6 dehydrogenase TviB [Candidatus Muiribacterium halophilum]|uniref:Vi polysaccharide biosynthesis UDP-N-acetylglucosamine C-6 dehydrogenase TviB n=1 Tax=Muiribacterium halophilum TaxID=2053465 RepID=A0A2N5ZJV1_MUIH1|nr:MAG: Vi polysaccharide biosynthesis UDP-N-acetylglucosamine C-6 dehydrogenase TviB [Candidatus Muirbacterium halophilum]
MRDIKIGVIGLGYVGLPLAVEFGKIVDVIGFDINKKRVEELKKFVDKTLEVDSKTMKEAKNLKYSCEIEELKTCNFFIVTVPTPIDEYKVPDLTPVRASSHTVGKALSHGDYVVYESTVYPGVTEDICVDILEKESGLKFNEDFYVGYSPERINPGDKEHTFSKILKVVSGSTPDACEYIAKVYEKVVKAGVYKAKSIKVAEAAKVIENTQRDVNIALINELSMLFNTLGIDTRQVLEAAGTKWNFLPFFPGLVGGHCIGVDPYYLTFKAQHAGYHPQMILAGRRINDNMGKYVSNQVMKIMTKKKLHVVDSNILLMGFTFKENCPDTRNTRVIDIFKELKSYNANVDIWDPWADIEEAKEEYGLNIMTKKPSKKYSAVICAVGHDQFKNMNLEDIKELCVEDAVVYDVKGILPLEIIDDRL